MTDLDAVELEADAFDMEAGDADAGRDFKDLDAHETQVALAEELSEDSETENVSDKTEDDQENKPAVQATQWAEEELAAHARMVEALLFAAAEPLDIKSIADRLPEGADIETLVHRIAGEYAERGVNLKETDGKWRFVTAGDVAHILDKERVTPRRLSRAAMETLAIIAYHQPCTRADIEDVRGVQVAKGSLDQLLEIGWVKLRGKRRDVPGRPILYGTTDDFLEQFGLESVGDLPGLADLKAAGLLDARLPPGFSVPSPTDGDDEEDEADIGEDAEFAQDFLADEDEESADT
ncbi:MAG: SMC-Scp complex subunit ScpB [Marinicaulis sp.]|nr:SMC-Scp complex subunit ScpB [Marinicaulis sp.]